MSVNNKKCPACKDSSNYILENVSKYAIRKCRKCGLSFADPMIAGDCEYYAGHLVYSQVDDTVIEQHFNSAESRFNIELLDLCPKGGRVLDVGCGFGAFVSFAVSNGYDALGIDFDANRIAAGRKWGGLGNRLFVGDVGDSDMLTSREHSFDLITMFEVIEHVEDPEALIQKARNLLSPGGLLALSCPNDDRWQPTGRIFVDYPPHHLTRWTPSALQEFLEANGFEHICTHVDSSIMDLLWVAYVNRSARLQSSALENEETPLSKKNNGLRRLKMNIYKIMKVASFPFDLILKQAGIGTMGMRMIVRKV